MVDSNMAEVTWWVGDVVPHLMRKRGNEVIDDSAFCEVPHMAKAYASGALYRGATAVTVVPYTGWDCIWPFLEAGLKVYVYPMNRHWPLPGWPRLWRSWQRMARRRYGKGRVATWPR